jgi:hypothetical protein
MLYYIAKEGGFISKDKLIKYSGKKIVKKQLIIMANDGFISIDNNFVNLKIKNYKLSISNKMIRNGVLVSKN